MNGQAPAPPDWGMTDQEFDQLRQVIHRFAGLWIGESKRTMVRARLQKRLAALELGSVGDYLALLRGRGALAEREHFISSLTTNVTGFFRESHHFETLACHALPELARRAGPISVWSAGCSSGQEPYSLAMMLIDRLPSLAGRVRILATDIDRAILSRARQGIYSPSELAGLSPLQRARHLAPQPDGSLRVRGELAAMVEFRALNLAAPLRHVGRHDVILCRNVAIYFSPGGQDALWQRLRSALRPGGWLMIGHAERIAVDRCQGLVPVGVTTYRRAPWPDGAGTVP